jgi:CheY-like chemotaxis protein
MDMRTRVDENDHQAPAAELRADARGPTVRRVLVVDDNRDAAEMTEMLLQLQGHVVMTAFDGRSALDVAVTFGPEVVLLDLTLPDLDGYELAKRLRELPSAREARFVAVTGWGDPSEQARTRACGFVAHLVKPFDVNVVLELVATAPRLDDVPARV